MNWITKAALDWLAEQPKPCLASEFDKEFSPVGPSVRDELVKQKIIRVSPRNIIEIVQPEEQISREDISRAIYILGGIDPKNFEARKEDYKQALFEELAAHRSNGYKEGFSAGQIEGAKGKIPL